MSMRIVLANLALLFGGLGFVYYIFFIIAGFLGCCSGMEGLLFHKIIAMGAIVLVIVLGLCMYNNCRCTLKRNKEK